MMITVALAGDTMLGRGVADRLTQHGPDSLFAPEIGRVLAGGDLVLVNLECCVSRRGEPTTAVPGKPFFFRAPPSAVRALSALGVDGVSLANNHALDYGPDALLDTRALVEDAGMRAMGAGGDVEQARAPIVFDRRGTRIGVLAVTDHPEQFAAGPGRPGVAYANLRREVPSWLTDAVRSLRERTDLTLVSAHWGPNLIERPIPWVLHAADVLLRSGADLVIGHSAHIFHGFTRDVLYDLGDFIDDYVVHPALRNDLGLIFLAQFEERRLVGLRAVPIAIDGCRTRLADPREHAWISDRLTRLCAAFGTRIEDRDDHLAAAWPA